MSEKSEEAFRTISEVADELGIPKHILRFWEVRFPQIRPMKRGGGRRYYRPQDVELLRGIQYLREVEGYTIKGVQKILREQGIDAVKAHWRNETAADERLRRRKAKGRAQARQGVQAERPEGRSPRASATGKADVKETLAAAIAALRECRGLLMGTVPCRGPGGEGQSSALR